MPFRTFLRRHRSLVVDRQKALPHRAAANLATLVLVVIEIAGASVTYLVDPFSFGSGTCGAAGLGPLENRFAPVLGEGQVIMAVLIGLDGFGLLADIDLIFRQ